MEDYKHKVTAQAGAEGRRRSRGWLVALLALSLAAACAGAASAQVDLHATIEQQATENDLDTDHTPVAKESDFWTLMHGARFAKTDVVEGSLTSFDTDLFDVAFRNTRIGLAGGSACPDPPQQAPGETDAAFGERVEHCEAPDGSAQQRLPVLYRFVHPLNEDERWERLELPGGDRPGYVGAITWIDSQRALIVGGTGVYPRREPPPDGKPPTDPAKADPAGKARAWIYNRASDSVSELELSALTPDLPDRAGMRGLSAVDCLDPSICFAGALGQVWEWRDGEFSDRRIDAKSPPSVLRHAQLFRYRVRDISGATAGTAGCCATDTSLNTPRLIEYDAESDSWSANDLAGRIPPLPEVPPVSPVSRVTPLSPIAHVQPTNAPSCVPWTPLPNSCLTLSGQPAPIPPPAGGAPIITQEMADQANPHIDEANNVIGEANEGVAQLNEGIDQANDQIARGNEQVDDAEAEVSALNDQRRAVNDKPTWPDSIYALSGDSAVLTPGGPEREGEPPSAITKEPIFEYLRGPWAGAQSFTVGAFINTALNLYSAFAPPAERDLARTAFSTARLVDMDTDAVGEHRATDIDGLGARGLLYSSGLARPTPDRAPNAGLDEFILNNPFVGQTPTVKARPSAEELVSGWEPVDEDRLEDSIRSRYYLLPSYGANAIDIVGEQLDGWVVGDHGAILRLSDKFKEANESASEPPLPRLGARRRESLSDRGAFDRTRPAVPAEAGQVPAIGGEMVRLPERRMIPYGFSGSAINEIVMSRDGSEGWAIGGASGQGPSLSRFDGKAWTPCDPVGMEERSKPDPACAALAPLSGYRDQSGNLKTANLTQVVRVPLEHDSDPTNDDELEILAFGTNYWGPETDFKTVPATVRLHNGRWRFVDPESGLVPATVGEVAFTAPDDGWMIVNGTSLRHFNGTRWIDCVSEPLKCGDTGQIPRHTGSSYFKQLKGLTTAGDRVFLYGHREPNSACPISIACTTRRAAMIIYHDRGGVWTDGSGEDGDRGGFDPAFSNPATGQVGHVESLSVVEGPDGFEGWAVGEFGGIDIGHGASFIHTNQDFVLMRLGPGNGEGWRPFRSRGSFEDYMSTALAQSASLANRSNAAQHVSYPSDMDPDGVYLANGSRAWGFDSSRGRFTMLDAGREQGTTQNLQLFSAAPRGAIKAIAPDGDGGFWAAVQSASSSGSGDYIFRYSDRAPKPIFEEVANPFGIHNAALTDLAGGPDGSVWVATTSDRVLRYDRIGGWEQSRIPGWEPGRIVTRAAQATAIALGPGGEGLVVGEEGRIAELGPGGVSLDFAAGTSCALGAPPPCGTSRTLRDVAISPDGSAIVGGDALSLLWRPANGDFRAVAKPQVASSTRITAVSYPTPSTAYLGTDSGVVFRGELVGEGAWRWRSENLDADGEFTVSVGSVADIAVNGHGHGYVVSANGIMERTMEGWRLLPARYGGGTKVQLSPGGESALIGDARGRILAGFGRDFHVAEPPDFGGGSPIVGFAYLPGSTAGSVDAWAATRSRSGGSGAAGSGDARLLRYRSDPGDALLDPNVAASALPDVPGHVDGELSIAAFGKSDCDNPEDRLCPEMTATTTTNELILERIIDELAARQGEGKLDFAVQSGDATDSAGLPASSLADLDRPGSPGLVLNHTQRAGQLKHRLYAELVANELEDRGVPLLGAIGIQDLSETYVCDTEACHLTKQIAQAGENFSWREAFAGRADPWGDGSDVAAGAEDGGIELEPAPGNEDNAVRHDDHRTDPDRDGPAPEAKAEVGGASTHYAVDVKREGESIARIVVVDTSLRSLAASEPLQQPQEIGGQLRFLERMICRRGQSVNVDGCTREEGQAAIVVSNTPTYSYGPGALSDTATDATIFETIMLRHEVDLVISGALGFNGLYYTLAPGLHTPCPGGDHPSGPPEGGVPECVGAQGGEGPDAFQPLADEGLSGVVPTLIAAGAGGKFGPRGDQPADGPQGQWHGYSVARLMPDGELVVEQRPVLDWIGLDAGEHTLGPRETLTLNGYGRSPISTGAESTWSACGSSCAYHYKISNPAITHRYDLLLADPAAPWTPCEASDESCRSLHSKLSEGGDSPRSVSASPDDATANNRCGPYLCLPERVGTVDRQSGQVQSGNGKYPDTFAIAMLSVDDQVATWPLVFKRSPSFVVGPASVAAPIPATPSAVQSPPQPPSPPNPPSPNVPQPATPGIPAPPPVPPIAASDPPEPQPPAPPAPPPPTEQPSPLNLALAPPALTIATPTAVIQPPTPPVNPAPPGGARREARQRQAAAQKSGADNEESGSQSDVDMADQKHALPGAEFRRHERTRPEPSFTALARSSDGVPAATGTLYGGGIALMAAIMALGWTHGRPRPKRRPPEAPSPAWSRARDWR